MLGAGRIWEDLRDEGEPASLNRVARLMHVDGLKGIPCKKKHRNKKSGTRPDNVENHLARDFAADEPNTRWVTGITYIPVVGGLWLYLRGRRSVLRDRGWLVDEPLPEPAAGAAGRAHGAVATRVTTTSDPA